jgi:hypothetical protein
MKTLLNMKPLNSKEVEYCWLLWGCVPYDTDWVRNSQLFKDFCK